MKQPRFYKLHDRYRRRSNVLLPRVILLKTKPRVEFTYNLVNRRIEKKKFAS